MGEISAAITTILRQNDRVKNLEIDGICMDLPCFAFSDGFDGFFDATVNQLVLHTFLYKLDQLFAHFVAGERVCDR